MEIKSAALIGLGAIGAYLAGSLSEVLGNSFYVIAKGERAKRIKKDGMIINGVRKDFYVEGPEKENKVDLAIIITKMGGLKEAFNDMKNHIGENTVIMTPLNGVESEEIAKSYFGEERIIYSLSRVSVLREKNKVFFDKNIAGMEFGEKENKVLSPRIKAIANLFDKANICYTIPQDMILAMWEKFVCNVSENQVSAILGLPYGFVQSDNADYLRCLAAKEAIAIAQKKGIAIADDYPKQIKKYLLKIPIANKTSTLQDLENGYHTEVEIFSGAILRMGKELGIPTPINDFLYHAIKTLEEKNDGKIKGLKKHLL